MKWFKHDTDASNDAKIKKLLIKYGAVGYAIYFHCIELIANDLNENNITFELEHDSEIIADNLKIKGTADKSGIEIVEEIMRYIVDLGLFISSDGKIICFKLLKRLDTSMTSNMKFRGLIMKAKESHDLIMTQSCNTTLDKTRREEKRRDNKKQKKPDVKHEYGEYKHVLLSDKQYEELKDCVDDREKWIKKLDESIEEKGNIYNIKNFKMAAIKWYKRENKDTQKQIEIDERVTKNMDARNERLKARGIS